MKMMMLSNINVVLEDYKPDESIWREYNDDMLLLKKAINNLSDADRIIFVMYSEYGSLRKVGKQLGISHSIIYKNITRIKREIYDYIRVNCNNSGSSLYSRFEQLFNNNEEVDMESVEGEE